MVFTRILEMTKYYFWKLVTGSIHIFSDNNNWKIVLPIFYQNYFQPLWDNRLYLKLTFVYLFYFFFNKCRDCLKIIYTKSLAFDYRYDFQKYSLIILFIFWSLRTHVVSDSWRFEIWSRVSLKSEGLQNRILTTVSMRSVISSAFENAIMFWLA